MQLVGELKTCWRRGRAKDAPLSATVSPMTQGQAKGELIGAPTKAEGGSGRGWDQRRQGAESNASWTEMRCKLVAPGSGTRAGGGGLPETQRRGSRASLIAVSRDGEIAMETKRREQSNRQKEREIARSRTAEATRSRPSRPRSLVKRRQDAGVTYPLPPTQRSLSLVMARERQKPTVIRRNARQTRVALCNETPDTALVHIGQV